VVSLVLFGLVLGVGLLGPRFWCKYVCPSGAMFSLVSVFHVNRRNVEASCTRCGRCVPACDFDAIEPDFTTRAADCTFCQACGGVCPSKAIRFAPRWERIRPADSTRAGVPSSGRRRFLGTAAGLAGGLIGGGATALASKACSLPGGGADRHPVVRPPGSVPEELFLQLCIRCGECFQACPNNVLQPLGFQQGIEGLWTPRVVADWSGCEPSCSNCGQVCPTGAIRALALEEKRVARIGLAVVNRETCLPFAGRESCQLCVDECKSAGYNAMEFLRVGTQADDSGMPLSDSGFLAPVVIADRCVGCGLCQTRCRAINVKSKHLLTESAIQVEAGEGKEDRLASGSYLALREEERLARQKEQEKLIRKNGRGDYVPGSL
jgi:ferredoxin